MKQKRTHNSRVRILNLGVIVFWFVWTAAPLQAGPSSHPLAPGEDIQNAIDTVAARGGGIVTLGEGIHLIDVPLEMKSGVTLQGVGMRASILKTTKDIKMIIQAAYGLRDVTIQNLVLIGSPTVNAGGIHLISFNTDHDRITLSNVHVFETGWGVHIKGAQNVLIENCHFARNGVKGKEGYAHNLYLRRCTNALVRNTKLLDSTTGNGCNISYSENITLDHCEVHNNYFRGIRAANTVGYTVTNCWISGNGRVGLLANSESMATKEIRFENNVVLSNGGGGIRGVHGVTGTVTHCISYGNNEYDYNLPSSVQASDNSSEAPVGRYFVSLQGNDHWSGLLPAPLSNGSDGPFRTLEAARDAIRKLPTRQKVRQPIEILILPGTYFRDEAFLLDARDSGTERSPMTYRAWSDEPTILSGGREVRNWSPSELNGQRVLVSDLSQLSGPIPPFEQLWVNGQRATQARTPNQGYLQIPSVPEVEKNPAAERRAKTHEFDFAPADEPLFEGVEEGVAVVFNKWLEYHMPLDRIDFRSNKIVCSKQSGRALEMGDHYYLEGDRALLDEPGEWYLDRQVQKLYYIPRAGETEIVAVIPSLVTVLKVEGDAEQKQWVEHVQFHGLTFSHTTWNLPRDLGPSGYSQADIQMDGAVRLLDARNCVLEDCEITAVGNYGLEMGPGSSHNRILACEIHDLGAGGLLIGPKIRPPSDKEDPNRTDFPPVLEDPADACRDNEIADCRIYEGGRYYHCAVGIWIGQSPDNHIHHNEIYNFYYSGISSGWTWGYGRGLATGNRFEYNHIHHIGRWTNGDGAVLSDLGGIYTLGDQTGTVIRYNHFHDIWAGKYGGWAIYCDEGSRHILIENNLATRCRHACFNQHYGKDNIVRNNIFAFADTSVVMLAKAQPHTGFVLTNNILLSDGTPIYAGGYAYDVNHPGGFEADHNLVWSLNGPVIGAQNRFPSRVYEPNEPVLRWEQWQALGNDQHSVVADPGFTDPTTDDFSLPEDSPAFKIGFKPFTLDEVGPRS